MVGERETLRPRTTAASNVTTPKIEAWRIWPGFHTYIQSPMRNPMGIEQPMVKVPQALSRRALTTASPKPARATTRMKRVAIAALRPAAGLISSVAIWARERPLRRTEAAMIMKSCTAPASTTPARIQTKPGMKPNCAARTGPINGPAPVMAAKWWPKRTHLLVG
jgi:hypothetical protein